ncbi:hypothetical protein PILCRDRAFT_497151 [Piloderma croceum F 1598]|uniref:Uncharacterized protein n=1 Tax=Piloderma croceum (strain F 1598) TaxID=765440 RepID=A0A0C3B5V6_PILCF|nr:hypothetical protein PILCRDRAFT_497151 [Piloderma croceum F 1598]
MHESFESYGFERNIAFGLDDTCIRSPFGQLSTVGLIFCAQLSTNERLVLTRLYLAWSHRLSYPASPFLHLVLPILVGLHFKAKNLGPYTPFRLSAKQHRISIATKTWNNTPQLSDRSFKTSAV